MVKIGVADYGMLVWYGGYYDYEERARAVGAIGYDGIEKLHPLSAEDALMKAAWLKKMGMRFATCNAANQELSIKWGAALGVDYIWNQVHGASFEAYLRQTYEMTKAAKMYGVRIAVHNHLGSMAETQEQVETILRECPDTYLLFDTGHLAVAGGDVRYIAEKYYDRIAAYHLKEWKWSDTPEAEKWQDRGHFCGLGQGDLPIDNEFVFKQAIRKGFDGWVHIEHDTHKQDPLIDLKESFDILQKWRNEI